MYAFLPAAGQSFPNRKELFQLWNKKQNQLHKTLQPK
jgi:hypothetical protein